MMAFSKMLPFYLLPLLVIHASASCSDLTHSECDMRATSDVVLLAIQLPTQQNCRKLCESIGEGCKFFTFEEDSFHQNCQLYRQSMSSFVSHHCNIISGTKEVNSTCDDYDNLRNDQVVQAKCQYDGVVEETMKTNSWEHCQQFCTTLSQCGAWEFLKEEQVCHILGSSQKKCLVNMGAYAPYTQCETASRQWSGIQSKVWTDKQCKNIGMHYRQLDDCKIKCLDTPTCTAINYRKADNRCILRRCKEPVQSPQWQLSNWNGYYIIESNDRPQGLPSSCLPMSHSECDMRDRNVLLALQVDAEANCQAMCEAIGEGCKFFTFEENSYHENCQLHTIEMNDFVESCNVLSGPSSYCELCDYGRMRSGDVVEGQCEYGVVEERVNTQSWQSCQMLSRGVWQAWKYFKEQKSCHLLGSQDKDCLVKFGVADPDNKCGGGSDV